MKYLIKGTDITGADWKRVLLSDNKVFLKDFSPYKMIDLGLTSHTLWADRNIGATDIYDGGKLFQWGDPTPYDIPEHTNGNVNQGQKMFSWSDYKFSGSGANKYDPQLTKYCNNASYGKDGFVDNKLVLDPEDDAAHVNMGGEWKMPTKEQVNELFKETTQELYAKLTDGSDPVKVANGVYNKNDGSLSWTYIGEHTTSEVYGKISYMKLLSKTNSNFLVVPSSVDVGDGNVDGVGRGSNFWSSSVDSDYVNCAWQGFFGHNYYGTGDSFYRCNGVAVRGVVGQ